MQPAHAVIDEIAIRPCCGEWQALIALRGGGEFAGRTLWQWRTTTRQELGLDAARPVIATGHQTLLWHPGILAKYMAVEAFAKSHDVATANLIVDQHAEGFGEFDIPVRRSDGALAVRALELCRPRPRKEVPMGRHEAFTPPRVPDNLAAALPCIDEGVRRISEAVYAHRAAPNAALQMAEAIADLMQWGGWVRRMPIVTSTDLIHTSLATKMMRAMAADPWRCAECYNRAVAQVPEAGVAALLVRDDYVELPLWRIREDGRRMHAYDNDVEIAINDPPQAPARQSKIQNQESNIDLMPRALFMTALVRLGMCDLFVHGTGGARYDRAMELWIKDWLGLAPNPIAVVTATMRLPLMGELTVPRLSESGASPARRAGVPDVANAHHQARRLWHNPQPDVKRTLVDQINAAPRNSLQRRQLYLRMHEDLARLRSQEPEVQRATDRLERAKRTAADAQIAQRRDWAFPLYPKWKLDELNAAVAKQVTTHEDSSSPRQLRKDQRSLL